MICPVCERDMIVIEYQNIELDHCASCKGVWLDSGELELLLKSHQFEEAKPFLDGVLGSPEAATTEKEQKCPVCDHRMKKAAIGEQHRILIDLCPRKHGLWLDGGEVSHLVRHIAGEHQLNGPGEEVISYLEEVFGAPKK